MLPGSTSQEQVESHLARWSDQGEREGVSVLSMSRVSHFFRFSSLFFSFRSFLLFRDLGMPAGTTPCLPHHPLTLTPFADAFVMSQRVRMVI